MAKVSRDVARVRFAAVVRRALADARERGMTDSAIHKATGITPSTFHRWQRAEGREAPQLEKVTNFFAKLDLPVRPALIALGMDDDPRPTMPEPVLDADLARLARILRDPQIPEATKQAIRHTVRSLAATAQRQPDIVLMHGDVTFADVETKRSSVHSTREAAIADARRRAGADLPADAQA